MQHELKAGSIDGRGLLALSDSELAIGRGKLGTIITSKADYLGVLTKLRYTFIPPFLPFSQSSLTSTRTYDSLSKALLSAAKLSEQDLGGEPRKMGEEPFGNNGDIDRGNPAAQVGPSRNGK